MRSYLLDCITDKGTEHFTPEQKFIYIYDRFDNEYCYPHNLKRYNNNKVLTMAEWLSGFAINCDFCYNDILRVARKLHDLKPDFVFDKKLEDKIYNQWFKLLATHIMKNYILSRHNSITSNIGIIKYSKDYMRTLK